MSGERIKCSIWTLWFSLFFFLRESDRKETCMGNEFVDVVEGNPVIAAVKDWAGLESCCRTDGTKVVFVLFGDVCSIRDIVQKIKKAGKIAMVHIDLISGLNSKEIAVDYIKENTEADGIISTKPVLIKRAKELSMYSVLRYFLLDSMALENIRQQQYTVRPDMIEVLPGVMPKVIKKICYELKTPVIAGGLITDREDVMGALSAGAMAVSATNQEVWKM